MPTGTQIRRLLEGTYDNLNPKAVKLLEAVEEKHGFQSAKNFLNTLATDYDLVPKRGGDNNQFEDIAQRVWKKTTGTDLPTVEGPDRLERVRNSLNRLEEQFPEDQPAAVPKASGGYQPLAVSAGPRVASPTSGSKVISKSPFAGEVVDTTARDVGPPIQARGNAPLQLPAAEGGGGGGKSAALTAAAAGGAYAAGRALTGNEDKEKQEGAVAPAAETPRGEVGPPASAAKPKLPAGAPLPANSDILKGIGTFTPTEAPKASEFGVTKEGADYTGVEQQRGKLRGEGEGARLEYMREANALADELRGEKDSMKQRQIFEGLAHAVAHLAAGYIAQKEKIPLGELNLEKTDFQGERRAMLDEYLAREQTAGRKYAARKEQLEAAGKDIDREEGQIVRKWEGNQRLFDTALNTWRAGEDSKFRQWQSVLEGAKLKLQERGQAEDLGFKYANLEATRNYYEGLIDTAKDKNTINAARATLKQTDAAEKLLGKFRKTLTESAKAKTQAESEGKFGEAVGLAQQYKAAMGEDLMTPEEINGADPGPVIERLMGAAASGASKPKTIQQNGYTYTLNPETGNYE